MRETLECEAVHEHFLTTTGRLVELVFLQYAGMQRNDDWKFSATKRTSRKCEMQTTKFKMKIVYDATTDCIIARFTERGD